MFLVAEEHKGKDSPYAPPQPGAQS
ncbi:hypothetical protein CCP2SC5_400020 [Azospirillaceae bacterium]